MSTAVQTEHDDLHPGLGLRFSDPGHRGCFHDDAGQYGRLFTDVLANRVPPPNPPGPSSPLYVTGGLKTGG